MGGEAVLQHLVVERQQWRSHGFVTVDGVLPASLVQAAHAAAETLAEGTEEEWAASFPYSEAALNELTLSPRLLAACAGILGSTTLQVTRSALRVRTGDPDGSAAPAAPRSPYRNRILPRRGNLVELRDLARGFEKDDLV